MGRSAREHFVVRQIREKTAPLNIKIQSDAPPRANVLVGIIDFRYFFGGYITVFQFARLLALTGYAVRVIVTDQCPFEPLLWRRQIRGYAGLEDFFDRIEVLYAFDRTQPVTCSADDSFVATSWWTAHVANQALCHIRAERFVYLTQEYEPIFYNMGAFHVLARESYTFPHDAIFSTEMLRDYHCRERIGLYGRGERYGDEHSVVFRNAVLPIVPDVEGMRNRRKKRLLFYSRPEAHASRNLFEFGVLALSRALEDGVLDPEEWEFHGIGAAESSEPISLYRDEVSLQLLPRLNLNDYRDVLAGYDVGMGLMLSPHPSLVPIEMAAAGMLVVTTTYATKTGGALKGISSNFIPSEPGIESLTNALCEAARRVVDIPARIRGARIDWPQSWEDAFHEEFVRKVCNFLGPSRTVTRARSTPEEARERRGARAFIKVAARNPETFVVEIHPRDDMYRYTRELYGEKASYVYFRQGWEAIRSINHVLSHCEMTLEEVRSVLDFGCGHGRISRYLTDLLPSERVWVSDVLRDGVDFVVSRMGVRGFYSGSDPDDVSFPRSFQVIYAGSLFSHLPHHRFEMWLTRLYAALEDDGVLIFSTHGEGLCPPSLPCNPAGFTFLPKSESRALGSEEYGSTFVSAAWVRGAAGRAGVRYLYHLERELCEYQDIYVAAKGFIGSLQSIVPSRPPHGHVDAVRIVEGGRLSLIGWAIDQKLGAPVKNVRVYSDGHFLGRASLGLARPDINANLGRRDSHEAGWEFLGVELDARRRVIFLDEDVVVALEDHRGVVNYVDAWTG